jgi:hypothetical protein
MFGLFLIVNTSLIWRFVFKCLSLAIADRTASTLLTIEADGALERVIQGYALNTSNVSTSLLGPTVSFTALTTICKTESLLKCSSLNSYYKMSYVQRKGM